MYNFTSRNQMQSGPIIYYKTSVKVKNIPGYERGKKTSHLSKRFIIFTLFTNNTSKIYKTFNMKFLTFVS